MFSIVEKIIELLENELPMELHYKIDEFKHLVDSREYRQGFLVIEDLKKVKGWSPSIKLLGYMEQYWWELAN